MRILVLFDTVEGHTKKIAGAISGQIEDAGHEVIVTRASDTGYLDPGNFDAAVLCAPIHIGDYPAALVRFVQNWKHALKDKPCAFVSVTLAINSDDADEVAEATAFPTTLFERTGWAADQVHNAAGALKYLEYDFFKRWMMKRISAAEGGPVDTSRNYEFTDWDALKRFVSGFLEFAQARSP